MECGQAGLRDADDRPAAALDEDYVVRFDAAVGRAAMDAEARLYRLAAVQHRREERLDKDGQMDADGNLGLGQQAAQPAAPARVCRNVAAEPFKNRASFAARFQDDSPTSATVCARSRAAIRASSATK